MNPFSDTKWNPIHTPKPCRSQKYATIKNESFHRLVATTFLGPPPSEAHTVDHINNDCEDNRVVNLRWVLRSEQNRNRRFDIRRARPNGTQILVFDEVADTCVKFNSAYRAALVLSKQHGVKIYSADVLRCAKKCTTFKGLLFRIASQVEPGV